MPLIRKGGEADKLGNDYEAHWRLKLLMELIAGTSELLVIESFDRSLQIGIDAEVRRRSHNEFFTEFHSVKRQHATGAWTPSALLSRGTSSPLGSVIEKIKTDDGSRIGVFVSQSHVEDLPDLCDAAARSPNNEIFQDRLQAGSVTDRGKFMPLFTQVSKWTGVEKDKLHNILRRLEFRSWRDAPLEAEVCSEIQREIMRTDGSEVDSAAVTEHLAAFMILNLGAPITRQAVLDYIGTQGFCQKNLNNVPIAVGQVTTQNRRFTSEAEVRLVRNTRIPRTEAERITNLVSGERRRWIILTGDAGTGKSCVLAQTVEQLNERSVPTFAFRLDAASPADSMTKLKEFLAINWEPVMLLDGIAQRRKSVLIIDQVDALSEVGGRRNAQQWSVLRRLIDDAKKSPMMSIVLSCRKFDLDYDSQIKGLLKARNEQPEKIEVALLAIECVKSFLSEEGIDISQWIDSQIDILRVPLHLDLFIRCKATSRSPVVSSSDLYRRYLDQLRADSAAATPGWDIDEALHELVSCFSDSQAVALEWGVVDSRGLVRHCNKLISAGILFIQGSGNQQLVRFFHDTFYDHVFAAEFVRSKSSITALLTRSGERQELFRRTQCRQILALLREGTTPERIRYMAELRALLLAPKVRTHIKFFLLVWLNSHIDPSDDEWSVVKEAAKSIATRDHIYRLATWGKLGWFDLLNRHGQWSEWLRSRDERWSSGITWMFGQTDMVQHRGTEIAAIFEESQWSGSAEQKRWRRRLGEVLGSGKSYSSDAMFALFLRAFDEKWQELERVNFWQYDLRGLPNRRPEGAVKVLDIILTKRLCFSTTGQIVMTKRSPLWWQEFVETRKARKDAKRWNEAAKGRKPKLQRVLEWLKSTWGHSVKNEPVPAIKDEKPEGLFKKMSRRAKSFLAPETDERGLTQADLAAFLSECANHIPHEFARAVTSFAESFKATGDNAKYWVFSDMWTSYDHQLHEISGALRGGLARALSHLARVSPDDAKTLVDRLLKLAIRGLDLITMEAWGENPQFFSSDIVRFFKERPERLFYAPSSWSEGNAEGYYGRRLICSVHPFLSSAEFLEVERLIRATPEKLSSVADYKRLFEDNFSRAPDMKNPEDRQVILRYLRWINHRRFTVLSVLPPQRMSAAGRRKLTVWTSQYGKPDHSPPTRGGVRSVGSPIEKESLERMDDAQLLNALRRYDRHAAPKRPFEWSTHGLEGELRGMAASQKPRFLFLLGKMDESIEFRYQTAVVSGLVGWGDDSSAPKQTGQLSDDELTGLADRFAGTTDSEMAKAICWGLEKRIRKGTTVSRWTDILLHFALHHPNPATEGDDTSVRSFNGERNLGFELMQTGINRVRGVACDVLAATVFADRESAMSIRPHMPGLISDRSKCVRACMVRLLMAWLNIDRDEAVSWFTEMMGNDAELLNVPTVEHFLAYACATHAIKLATVIDRMVFQLKGDARLIGVGQTTRCAFNDPAWQSKVNSVLKSGDPAARKRTAEIAAGAWEIERLRPLAEQWLRQCFKDPDLEVRREASSVFRQVPDDKWDSAVPLASDFVNSEAFQNSASTFVWKLDDADPLPVPLVIHVVRRALELWTIYKGTPGKLDELRWGSTNIGSLVLLAYNNATSSAQKSECLDLLDKLLLEGLYDIGSLIKDTEAQVSE